MTQSKYQTFKILERQLQEQLAQMEALKQDADVAKAKDLEEHVRLLIQDAGLSVAEVAFVVADIFGEANLRRAVESISGDAGLTQATTSKTKKARKMKRYTNPHTGESRVVGKISGDVAEWVKQYGRKEVDSWVVIEE